MGSKTSLKARSDLTSAFASPSKFNIEPITTQPLMQKMSSDDPISAYWRHQFHCCCDGDGDADLKCEQSVGL